MTMLRPMGAAGTGKLVDVDRPCGMCFAIESDTRPDLQTGLQQGEIPLVGADRSIDLICIAAHCSCGKRFIVMHDSLSEGVDADSVAGDQALGIDQDRLLFRCRGSVAMAMKFLNIVESHAPPLLTSWYVEGYTFSDRRTSLSATWTGLHWPSMPARPTSP